MNGDRDDQVPAVDLAALTDDQRSGLACIYCGGSGGATRPILTPDNPQSSMVFVHVDSGVCLRRVASHVAGLHMRLVGIAEHAVAVLAGGSDTAEP